MKSFFSLFLSLFLTLLWLDAFSQDVRRERYVVLISIDGFKPDFYLDSTWHAPTLHRLMREGVYAQGVKPVYPSVTYPNHISMITGVLPGKHGIFYNKPVNNGHQAWRSSMIKTPTLFDALHERGLSTSAFFWPVMGESTIPYNVSFARRKGRSVTDRVYQTTSPDLWSELEQHAVGKISIHDVRNDANTGKMAAYIIQTYKPSLTAVRLVGVDDAQHKSGLKNQSVADALRTVDNAIKSIVTAIDQSGMAPYTTLLIVGDHGFCDVHSSLSPNVWLKKKRIYKSNDRWKAKFYTANGSAFLYLKEPGDERTLRRVRRVLDNLPNDQKKLFSIIEQDELQKVGGDPTAMFALNPLPGIVLRQTGSGKLVKQAAGGAHGYFADFPEMMTGFIGWGSGLNPGAVIQQMNVPDIAPIISRLLEIDFHAEDGVIAEEMFQQK